MIVTYQASEYARYDHQWPTGREELQGVAAWFAGEDSHLAVCLKATGKLIGYIALKPAEDEGGLAFNLGYIFHTGYHGRGYATEGCRAVLDRAFGPLGADRVVAGTAAANKPSCRLLRRLGMKQMGQHTGSCQGSPDGEPIAFVGLSFAISRDEWEAVGESSPQRAE